jgi:signal transduction histidine kinase
MNSSEKELRKRINWFINLRFIASFGVFITITSAVYIIGIKLPIFNLYLGNIILLLYNTLFLFYYKKEKDMNIKQLNNFANGQISLDIVMLTYFIYFAGGLENPFIFFFIFHMVIASILLSNYAAYLQATLATFIVGIITALEFFHIIPHYHLTGFISEKYCLSSIYLLSTFFVFSLTLYLTIYMATSIVNKLRETQRQLVFANKMLEEENRLKSRYVAIVSHDIQSSLSTIQNCLKVVLDGFTGNISEKTREMIARAEGRTLFLLQFVKDLLELSTVKTQKEKEKKNVPLKDVIKKVLEQLKPQIENKAITLSVSNSTNDISVYANEDRMEQLFRNLIENAIKYNTWGGKISVNIERSTLNGSVCVSIEDTGIGIPQQELDKIFEEFYRAKNAQKFEKDGTGLGLSIVKEIINAHQGDIHVESELGKGTRFTIILPSNKLKEVSQNGEEKNFNY